MDYLKDNEFMKLENENMVESDYENNRQKSDQRLSREVLNKRTTNTTVNKNSFQPYETFHQSQSLGPMRSTQKSPSRSLHQRSLHR